MNNFINRILLTNKTYVPNNQPIYEKIKQHLFLPEGWFEKYDDIGKVFYCCEKTEHTQWHHPGIPIGTIMPNGLPHGWVKDIDSKTGKEYFICHVGRFTSWSPPVPPKKNLYS